MGREVKRVALDFDWPVGTIWKGYLNPYSSTECKSCDGSGLNPETKKLSDAWYSLSSNDYIDNGDGSRWNNAAWENHLEQEDVQALLDADRLWDFTRVPINEEQKAVVEKKIADGGNSWLPFDNGYVPTADEINKWNRGRGFGHDSCNQWICVKAKAKRLGFYGTCPLCKGEGRYFCDEKYNKLANDWECIEPPEGAGWQVWETTSEGSPISPVFETPEELAQWLTDNNASSFGSDTATYDQWFKFIVGPGWAPSAVSDGNGIKSGVVAITE